MDIEEPAYEARFGWNARNSFMITISALFVIIGLFTPMSIAFRIIDIAFFGGAGGLMLAISFSRQIALRVDAQGVTLGGMPPRHRSTTTFVPWKDIERVVLWKQTLPPYGRSMPYIGLVRHPGTPALAGPVAQRVARSASAALALPVFAETLSTTTSVNGWRLDKQRLAVAIHQFAPGVPLEDGWKRSHPPIRRFANRLGHFRRAKSGPAHAFGPGSGGEHIEFPAQPDGKDSAVAAHTTWFEVDPVDAAEMSDAELDFAAALRAHSSGWAPAGVDGYIAGFATDGSGEPLIACADLTDPADPLHLLLHAGVHLFRDRVRGDRLHSQLFSLPEHPSPWALDSVGTHDELVELAVGWFRMVVDKPIVLYVWLHDDYAYAARYAFADTGETLSQYYQRSLAPAGQAEDLIAAGHVHGRGWIQTIGLPNPSCYFHIRGDLARGTVLPGVPATTKRGPLSGLWYE